MTWHVLHAGKFVDSDGVVLDRAEHEFIAASSGFSDAARRAIARQEPPRTMPVEWKDGFFASFVQLVMRIDGVDYTVRVIDHRAFEGSAAHPGRAYRRRTYLLQPCDEWQPDDVQLPIDAMRKVPEFQQFSTVQNWQPSGGRAATQNLPGDLGALLAGKLHIGEVPSIAVAHRLSAVLACLPPVVASRLHVAIGAPATLSCSEGSSSQAQPEIGARWIEVLNRRGADTSPRNIAIAAAQAWAEPPAADLMRPFEAIRAPLLWSMSTEAWLIHVDDELSAGRPVPSAPVEPSIRALRAVFPLLQKHQSPALIGALGKGWGAAWKQLEVDAQWRPIARLLAGEKLEDNEVAQLAMMDLQGEAGATAGEVATTLQNPNEAVRAFIVSRTSWATDFRRRHRGELVAQAFAATQGPDDHPIWRTKEGKAMLGIIGGQKINQANLDDVPPGWIAHYGDAASNQRWLEATGRLGSPGARNDGVAACLQLLAGHPVSAQGLAQHWPAFKRLLPVADALRLGVAYSDVEALLPNVDVTDAAATVEMLLSAPGLRRRPWLELFGTNGPWQLLAAGDGAPIGTGNERILANITGAAVPTASCNYAGQHPRAWQDLQPAAVLTWLNRGGDPEKLLRLAATAPEAVLGGLDAWISKTQSGDGAASAVAQRLRTQLSWGQRRTARRSAKILEKQ